MQSVWKTVTYALRHMMQKLGIYYENDYRKYSTGRTRSHEH